MAILVLLLIAVGIIVLVMNRNSLEDLRRDVAQISAILGERIRGLEARVAHLERRTGELSMQQLTYQATQQAVKPQGQAPAVAAVEEIVAPPASFETEHIVEPPPFRIETTPEQQPELQPKVTPAGEAELVPDAVWGPKATQEAAPNQPPAFASTVAAPVDREAVAKHSASLEERFGTHWLNKLGIASVVIGVAFFLAHQLSAMGPAGKAFTGLICGGVLLAGGIWLERKPTYRIFARAGIGGGWALLFFTSFAMHHVDAAKIISSLLLDLMLMLAVAAAMVLHSLRYRSQTVTGLAFLLGYVTVATSHFEIASGTVVFSLSASAVLSLGLVVVTIKRHWVWLELAGLIATIANHFLWLSLILPDGRNHAGFDHFWQSAGLIIFYWVVFRAAYLIRVPLDHKEERIADLVAVITSAGVLGLLKYQSMHPEWTFRALIVMGVIEMLLGIWAKRRRQSAFVVLTTIASVLLVAAVPYQFHGVSWPVLWLIEAHALALCGLRLGEPVFRRLGLLAGLAASVVLAIGDVLPLIWSRMDRVDLSHHFSLTVAMALAAVLFWIHSEVYPKRWPEVVAQLGDLEKVGLIITSWLGAASAATAIWVVLPIAWVPAGWLALVVLLGIIADQWSLESIALESDLLAACALLAMVVWDFANLGDSQKLASVIAIALMYVGMRRRTVPAGANAYVALTYSWTASMMWMVWMALALPGRWWALSWTALAIGLYEIGRVTNRGYLRWQGFISAAAAFGAIELLRFKRIVEPDLSADWNASLGLRVLGVVVVAGLGYWLQERTNSTDGVEAGTPERWVGVIAGAAATFAVSTWIPDLLPTWGHAESSSVAWAVLASALLAVSYAVHRNILMVHAIFVCLWTGLYGIFVALSGALGTSENWWQSDLCRLGAASVILFAGLMIAFKLRNALADDPAWKDQSILFKRPEQWFFFVPFGMMIVVLGVRLREGSITLGWGIFGVCTFLFALLVRQRSFRLGGLALLMLAVLKIVLMDIWTLAATDRYITLIALGCALLLVSFLYTRFPETFRRYL